MRTLVICGDHWHPANTVRQGLQPLGLDGFEFDWIEDAGEWSPERMASYPLVVMTKSNNISQSDQRPWVTDQVQQAFLEYVRKGNGLLVIHSGTAGYREMPVLRGLFGGVFTHHPPQCPVTIEFQKGSALTTGCSSFTVMDEHYFMDMNDTLIDLFMTTTSEHGTQPGGWTRTEGEGRICVLSPGHNLDVWLHPAFQALIGNALRWCLKQI